MPDTVTAQQAWGVFQVFLRVVALFSVAPVFGGREVPAPARIALALLFSLLVYPVVAPWLSPVPADLLGLAGIALRETLIGLFMGLIVSLLFQAALVAGDLLDIQMGFGMAAVFNPSLGAQTAMMGQFLYRYTLVVFLLLNGHHALLQAVIASFERLPAAHFAAQTDAFAVIGDVGMTVLTAGLRIAAPALATLLLVDVALALVSRAVPQMNVFVVGMPVKVVVGLLVFVAALGLTTTVLQTYAGEAGRQMLFSLRAIRGR